MIHGALKSEGFRIWLLAALAFFVASLCLVSLTWDGSCYLFWTAENGRPVIPHGRIINAFLLGPVAAARNFTNSPILLAQLYGFMCSILPLASLGLCLMMVRGTYRHLRLWVVAGILLVPWPGQMVLSAEAVPVLQVAWILIAFSLISCPWKWSPVAVGALAIQFIIHPVSAPLFGVTAVVCVITGWKTSHRTRNLMWAAIFLFAAATKMWHTLTTATTYERAHLNAMAFIGEMGSGLFASPFLAVTPLLYALWSEHLVRNGTRSVEHHQRIVARCWKIAIILSTVCILCPILWSGGLNFRKFGMFLAAPLAILAALDANRTSVKHTASFVLSPTRLTVFFTTCFILMSVTWAGLCFYTHHQAQKTDSVVITKADFPFIFRYSALNHWSNSTLLFVLEGRAPKHVLLGQEAKSTDTAVILFPDYEIPYKDGWFELGRFAK